ncbi:MAG TPA: tetratricopeptide repeat protein [Blastocatellia bacterium]|nr:tetratricopeptide repeat protein [Blastocatellia bacterium]
MKRFLLIAVLAFAAVLCNLAAAPAGAQTEGSTPHSPEGYFKRGVARYHQRDFKGAIADFNSAIEIKSLLAGNANHVRVTEPEAAELYYNRGGARYDLHDWHRNKTVRPLVVKRSAAQRRVDYQSDLTASDEVGDVRATSFTL